MNYNQYCTDCNKINLRNMYLLFRRIITLFLILYVWSGTLRCGLMDVVCIYTKSFANAINIFSTRLILLFYMASLSTQIQAMQLNSSLVTDFWKELCLDSNVHILLHQRIYAPICRVLKLVISNYLFKCVDNAIHLGICL